MTNWKYTLEIKKDNNLQNLAKQIVEKLIEIPEKDYLEETIEEFNLFISDKDEDEERFDSILEDLYDWGDMHIHSANFKQRMCWIRFI